MPEQSAEEFAKIMVECALRDAEVPVHHIAARDAAIAVEAREGAIDDCHTEVFKHFTSLVAGQAFKFSDVRAAIYALRATPARAIGDNERDFIKTMKRREEGE